MASPVTRALKYGTVLAGHGGAENLCGRGRSVQFATLQLVQCAKSSAALTGWNKVMVQGRSGGAGGLKQQVAAICGSFVPLLWLPVC